MTRKTLHISDAFRIASSAYGDAGNRLPQIALIVGLDLSSRAFPLWPIAMIFPMSFLFSLLAFALGTRSAKGGSDLPGNMAGLKDSPTLPALVIVCLIALVIAMTIHSLPRFQSLSIGVLTALVSIKIAIAILLMLMFAILIFMISGPISGMKAAGPVCAIKAGCRHLGMVWTVIFITTAPTMGIKLYGHPWTIKWFGGIAEKFPEWAMVYVAANVSASLVTFTVFGSAVARLHRLLLEGNKRAER